MSANKAIGQRGFKASGSNLIDSIPPGESIFSVKAASKLIASVLGCKIKPNAIPEGAPTVNEKPYRNGCSLTITGGTVAIKVVVVVQLLSSQTTTAAGSAAIAILLIHKAITSVAVNK